MSDDGGFEYPGELNWGINRTMILDYLAQRFGYKTYLEIGVAKAENLAELGHPFHYMVSVDPDPDAIRATYRMTSDEFFERNFESFDLIFVDGLHRHGQAYKDVLNALDCMNVGGTVVMHDCSPPSEIHQRVPRSQYHWTGDVWRAYLQLREIKELYMEVIDTDFGVGIIQQGEQVPLPDYTFRDMTYEAFAENREGLLNLQPTDCILGKKVEW